MVKYLYLKTIDLKGVKATYQIPRDINDLVVAEYIANRGYVKSLYKGALVNVPATRYADDGSVKLKVVKVLGIFTQDRCQYWRCRGQFVPYQRWSLGLEDVKGCFSYMTHDYSKINKARIKRDLLKWYSVEKGWMKLK